MMKKVSLFALLFLFLGFAPHVFAQSDFTALAPIPGLTQGVTADSSSLPAFFNNLYKYAIGLAAVLAVIMIIWGGLEISTQDSVSKQGAGRERITQAIIGLVLVLSPVLVFSIINPNILNLSLGLKQLDTVAGTPTSSPYVSPTPSSTNLFDVSGEIMACGSGPSGGSVSPFDCTVAKAECESQKALSPVATVVCLYNGKIDTRYTPTVGMGPSGSCPAGEIKKIQCQTVAVSAGNNI